MADAMHSPGGVPGLCVRLCDRVVSSPLPQIKLDGVSTIANVEGIWNGTRQEDHVFEA